MNYMERLDNLRFGAAHKKLLIGSGIGWALDALDVGLIAYLMAALTKEWDLSRHEVSWLASIGFVGMMIGASLGGRLADRIGRRTVFAATLLIYGIATGASAFAGGLGVLLALRFLVGVGLGAELPVASTLVAEYSPRHIRGRMVVALESFWALGWMGAALIGYLVIPHTIAGIPGWRISLLIGIVPALYALVIRRTLPESVQFLLAKGRTREAEAAVAEFEAGSRPRANIDHSTTPAPTNGTAPSIFSPALRTRTAGLWAVWFFVNLAYYGAFIWMPSLLVMQGHSLVRSFGYTLIMTLAQLPGYAAAAWLVEVWGRRITLATFLTGAAASAIAFGTQDSAAGIIITGCVLSFFTLGAWGALYAIGPEIYPARVRGTGTGAAAAVGRLAAILAPLIVPFILDHGEKGAVFLLIGVSFALAAAATFALPERTNKALEAVS